MELLDQRPQLRLFRDTLELKPGAAWQSEINKALDSCRKVVPVYSPAYLRSPECQEEFNIALLRHKQTRDVLFPLYLYTGALPPSLEVHQYEDCREGNMESVRRACSRLLAEL